MLLRKSLLSIILFCLSAITSAADAKKFCMYDPVGTNGPVITFFADLKAKGLSWNLDIEIQAYLDEKVALNDFKAGICDAVFLTSMLSAQFVPFGGTLDAVGGIHNEDQLAIVLKALTTPKVAPLLKSPQYEMAATLPMGSVYFYVNDKAIDTVEEFSGKKISILNEDPQSIQLAKLVGASPVGTTLTTFSGQFNNGNIDILPMVALGYNVFELYHGLGERGGIIDEKLLYGMMQLTIHRERFTDNFGQSMREYILSRLPDINKLMNDAEAEIPAKYWIKTNDKTKQDFRDFKREIRLALREEGIHHPKALKMLWKIRCTTNPAHAECSKPE